MHDEQCTPRVGGPRPVKGADITDADRVEMDAMRQLAADSATVAFWVLTSRISGFVRAVVIAAVLGPTYFGNIFQATNTLPGLVFEFLTGSLLVSLLVPAVVRALDSGGRRAATRLANSFLGLVTAGFVLVAIAGVVAGPALLALLSSGVADPGIAEAQQRVGSTLLIMLMPQVVFYGLAAVGAAVQNAHGRFALAAAAPIAENVGIIATMLAVGIAYPSGFDLTTVPSSVVVVLGLGTTAAVALHAGLQWIGAHRVGVTLVPRLGWRDPELRRVLRQLRPSIGYAGLNSIRYFVIIAVANQVAGGVVAFTIALNFFMLPVAIFARPVAVALLPRLARLAGAGRLGTLHDEAVRGAGLALVPVIPAGVAFLVLSGALAQMAAFGEMATPGGRAALAVSLAALSVGVIAEAGFVVATHVSYAIGDARAPFRAMITRTVVSMALIWAAAVRLHDFELLIGLGLAVTIGNAASLSQLVRAVRRNLPRTEARLLPSLRRATAAAVVMAGPAYLVALLGTRLLPGPAGGIAGSLGATLIGATIFVALLRLMHAPELTALLRLSRRSAGATEVADVTSRRSEQGSAANRPAPPARSARPSLQGDAGRIRRTPGPQDP